MPSIKQKAVFAVRKTQTVSNMFMLGWGLRIPLVSKEAQRALRRRLLDLRGSTFVEALRLLRGEVRGRLNRIDGSIDRGAEAKARRAAEAGGVLSFDFYDTLFTRASATPEDVLAYVGHRLALEGLDDAGEFATTRRKADAAARLADTRGDVTLAEIYDAFPERWSAARRARAMALELAIELSTLQPRRSVVALSRDAKRRGGTTAIVSDTCMDAGFIGSVLERHGIADLFDHVYCSSDVLRRKDDGTIWPWLKRELPGAGAGFTHIGDNNRSDVVQPRKSGVSAVGVTSAALTAELRGFPVPKHWRSANHDWRSGIVLGPAIARIGNDPFLGGSPGKVQFEEPYDFGYAVIGPLMFGFMSWIVAKAAADGVDRLFFLSRDGYFLQSIYEACARGGGMALPSAHYLCVSRRSVVPAHVYRSYDLDLVLKSRFKGSLRDLLQGRLGIDVSDLVGPDVADAAIRLPQDRPRVVDVMTAHREVIRDALKGSFDDLTLYLDRSGFTGSERAAIVDFSASGTIQMAMQGVMGRGLNGYYMMISRAFGAEDGLGGRSSACYVDAQDQWQLQPVQAGAILLEGLLTAPYGQITGYREVDGAMVPVHGAEPDSGPRFPAIRQAMEGAERYGRDLVEAYGGEVLLIDVPKLDVQRPLGAFLAGRLKMPPALRDAITIEDDFGGNGRMAFHS